MLDNAKPKRELSKRVRPVLLAGLILLSGLAIVCQSGEYTWKHGHDRYRLLKVWEWDIVEGYWDGTDGHGHRTAGRIYKYGIVNRITNMP